MNKLKEMHIKLKKDRLKVEIRMFLKYRGSSGARKDNFWNDITSFAQKSFKRKDYGLRRMNDMLTEDMKDELEEFTPDSKYPGDVYYRLRPGVDTIHSVVPAGDVENFPPLSQYNEGTKSESRRSSVSTDEGSTHAAADSFSNSAAALKLPQQLIDLTDENSQDSDIEIEEAAIIQEHNKEDSRKMKNLEKEIVNFLSEKKNSSGIKMSKFLVSLRSMMVNAKVYKKLRSMSAIRFLNTNFPHLLTFNVGASNSNDYIVNLNTDQIAVKDGQSATKQPKAETRPSAIDLMSQFSGWGKPATVPHTASRAPVIFNNNQSGATKPIPSESFISLVDDDAEDSMQRNTSNPMPGTSAVAPHQIPGMPQIPQVPQLINQLMPRRQELNFLLQPQAVMPNNNPFAGGRHDPSLPDFRQHVIDLATQPIEKHLFEAKTINVRPVYVPRGQPPTHEFVNITAQECVDTLSEANEHVTRERVEKLLCQRFQCYNVRQLGFGYIDQVPCVNEINRMICKMNAYILAFVKSRSICTLHELKENLCDYAPGNDSFESLKLGPLQRFPVVFEQFKFPPDLAVIPAITSMDVLDHFQNYLTKGNLWTKRLELEPFMDYLVEQYDADNAYMLGVRIRSMPLAAAVLKKSHRDSSNKRREIEEHFKTQLHNEIGEAFRKFRSSMLQSGEGEGLEVRTHYMKMRPELVLREILEKFNILLLTIESAGQAVTGKIPRTQKIRRVVEEFWNMLHQEKLVGDILHLAICMSSLAIEQSAMALLSPAVADDQPNNMEGPAARTDKPPPKKDDLISKLHVYIERCLQNSGSLNLVFLDRIEQKLLEDFDFTAFTMMGYGRFLEFLLAEAKQLLEEGGGQMLSTGGSHGDVEVSYKPQQHDILDFIKQCKQSGITQTGEVENALCQQFGVKEVRHLGHGNIIRLLGIADKPTRHMYTEHTVVYESSLAQPTGSSYSSGSKVGILGHQTRDAAKICLHNCPLLEDLATWSQWSLVFEPEHGKLKDFVLKYGGETNKNLEGGRMATLDFMAMETKPGHLVKIVSSTSPQHFVNALKTCNIQMASGHLVSMAASYKGVNNMPLALLSGHMKTALIQIHAAESNTGETAGQRHTAAVFVLQCLLHIPSKIAIALANQILLEPLGQVIGSTKSKQLLLELCTTARELNQIMELGCLLGIQEWASMIEKKCAVPDTAIHTLPSEEEVYLAIEMQDDKQDEEEEADGYETVDEYETEDDVDKILEGDADNALTEKTQVTETTQQNTETKIHAADAEKTDSEAGAETSSKTTVDDHKVAAEDTDIVMEDAVETEGQQPEVKVSTCEVIVNQIRKDEFGVGVHLSDDGHRLMKIQQERLGRSLDRLSRDLYSKDTHFVLELVQNADDNSYAENLTDGSTDACPAVKFIISNDGIAVMNNETGFREKDIRALCDVGRSTKGKHKFGYIGQKGIGFKSVFRVTDDPEVHSNGYHIKFDVNSGPMGYILPHWVTEDECPTADEWMTHIVLKLKADMRLQTRTLAARFNDIHPSLLLFLHRLRAITIKNEVENSVQVMRRRDVGDNIIEIEHTHGLERWLVMKQMLDATQISVQAKSGAEVESTEIALAFPIQKHAQKSAMQLPAKQPVFAFLPLRSYGFRFIVQGDFDVPSSREDVDRDSSWNQWLRNELHNVFLDALDIFKNHKEFSMTEAVCMFLQFVPMEDEVLDFFKPVASDILKKLKARPCVPTQPNSQGSISWKMPSQTVRVRDPLVRSVVTADLLHTHLNLHYLHSDVAASLNPTLTSCLGIETLTSDHLFQLGKALIVNMGTHCGSDADVVLIGRWLACMYRSLDEFQQDDAILATLKAQRLLPLSNGELVSLHDKTVFYPIPDLQQKRHGKKDVLFYLQQDVNSLHPMLLKTGDDEVDSQVQKLLLRLGIKQLSPFDIINHHIIPVFKTDAKKKSADILISFLVYIKEQVDRQVSVCNLEELKDVAMVMTNHGLKNAKQTPVHFPPQYGSQLDLQRTFSGYDWTLLDTCYLPSPLSQVAMQSWHNFFTKLGVEDFISIRQTDVTIRREQLAQSTWKSQCEVWPQDEPEFVVKDFASEELQFLIKHNTVVSGGDTDNLAYVEQMKQLCFYLDRHWESYYSRYCVTQVCDKDGKILKDTATSFSIILQTSAWLPGMLHTNSVNLDGSVSKECKLVLREPSCLYMRSPAVENLLLNNVLYLNVPLNATSFCHFLRIKTKVEIETVKEQLLSWSERTKPETPAVFCTSLEHMQNVYMYLSKELKRQDFQDLLRNKPVIFVPDKTANASRMSIVAGKMLNRNEVWLSDKTGLFDQYRSLLEEYHSEICKKRTISGYYSNSGEILQLFSSEGRLDSQPKIEEYIELLGLMCVSGTPKEAKLLSDVLYVFTTIGQALASRPEGMPDDVTADMVQHTQKAMVKKKLFNQKVFPSKSDRWVSLSDLPLIADNREWENMFAKKPGVHFLDMEDKSRPGAYRGNPRHKPSRETRIQPDMINIVIEMCGVKKLSEVVHIDPAPSGISPCPQLQEYLHKIVPHVQHYLLARFCDVYQQLEQQKTKEMLADAKFYQTHKLEVTYRLIHLKDELLKVLQEKCVIQPPTFYFHQDYLQSIADINKEIARYFSDGDTDCNTSLRSFLSELNNIISGLTDEDIQSLLQRHDAHLNMDITDEEVWSVEAPPKPAYVPPPPREEPMLPETWQPSQRTVGDEGDRVMKSWPPVAGNTLLKRDANQNKNCQVSSNIWPPPQAKSYMQSVKDLPSNILIVKSDKEDDAEVKDGDASGKATPGQAISGQGTAPVHIKPEEANSIAGEAISGHPGGVSTGGDSSIKSEHPTPPSSREDEIRRKRKLSAEQEEQMSKRHSGIDLDTQPMSPGHGRDNHELQHGQGHEGPPRSPGQGQPSQGARTGSYHQSGYVHRATEGGHKRHVDAVWSSMATDYSYDELGKGPELDLPMTTTLGNEAGDPEVGFWGEELVAQYLDKQKEVGNIIDFSWKNSSNETGLPYDFEVNYADESGMHTDYIEVKSTRTNDKEVFEVSVQQIKFAEDKKQRFHIFRVFNAGCLENVRLIRITDLNIRLSQKQVKLCMLI